MCWRFLPWSPDLVRFVVRHAWLRTTRNITPGAERFRYRIGRVGFRRGGRGVRSRWIGRPVPGEEMLTLSLRNHDRLTVLRQVDARLISARRGAELLGMSARQLRRLRRRFEKDGDEAVIHGLRGRTPNDAKPTAVRARALERAGDAVFADSGPTLLAEHLSRDPKIGPLRAVPCEGGSSRPGAGKFGVGAEGVARPGHGGRRSES
ncbi:MAG: hypothetical protein EA350_06875 [Gemmatimonadales bacterium]|nr:MAG: hypothetical protein EA350_06875 [Gemmatimonadales bacterium]